MRFGLSNGFPAAFRSFCHFFFMARIPSIIASELPTVLVPIALESFSWVGTLKRRAIIETQRFWISLANSGAIQKGYGKRYSLPADTGYSSKSQLVNVSYYYAKNSNDTNHNR
jgi:hypothetical protein